LDHWAVIFYVIIQLSWLTMKNGLINIAKED
jgi:hypothetical protein